MSLQKQLATLHDLLNRLRFQRHNEEPVAPYRRFGHADGFIAFQGVEDFFEYEEALKMFYDHKDIPETISLKVFEDSLVRLLREFYDSGETVSRDRLSEFYRQHLDKPILDSVVLRPVVGIVVKKPKEDLGPFCLYNLEESKQIIAERLGIMDDLLWTGWEQVKYAIGTEVKARDTKRANEIADEKFELFENIIRFNLSPDDTRHRANVVNWDHNWIDLAIIASQENWSTPTGWHGPFLDINLSDPFFFRKDNGNEYLWSLAGNKNLTRMQQSLLGAVNWLGKAQRDLDYGRKFLLCVIALETLLTIDDQSILRPGITYQIAESVALLLGNGPDERLDLESRMKKLYGIRSAISHGGKKVVTMDSIQEARAISTAVIRLFLVREELRKIPNQHALRDYLRKLKYS